MISSQEIKELMEKSFAKAHDSNVLVEDSEDLSENAGVSYHTYSPDSTPKCWHRISIERLKKQKEKGLPNAKNATEDEKKLHSDLCDVAIARHLIAKHMKETGHPDYQKANERASIAQHRAEQWSSEHTTSTRARKSVPKGPSKLLHKSPKSVIGTSYAKDPNDPSKLAKDENGKPYRVNDSDGSIAHVNKGNLSGHAGHHRKFADEEMAQLGL